MVFLRMADDLVKVTWRKILGWKNFGGIKWFSGGTVGRLTVIANRVLDY